MSGAHGIGMTSMRTRRRLVQRLQEAGIGNPAVLEAMLQLPRHLFVDEALASRAYEDTALPIGFGQTLSQPFIVARMTETLLAGGPLQKVLEVGTGSAYQAAVLALVAGEVYGVERVGALAGQARERLRALGLHNVRVRHGDGSLGWPKYAPYDGILITAAARGIPAALLKQLASGGRLVAPLQTAAGTQELVLLERSGGAIVQHLLGPVSFVPLLGGVL